MPMSLLRPLTACPSIVLGILLTAPLLVYVVASLPAFVVLPFVRGGPAKVASLVSPMISWVEKIALLVNPPENHTPPAVSPHD